MTTLRRVRLAVQLPLANRCHEDFAAMPAAAGGRACAACEHVVHDLSAMTEREAARFVTASRGRRVCMRYLARADGTIVYRPEPPRAAAVVVAALAACTPWQPTPGLRDDVEVVPAEAPAPATVVVPAAAKVEPPDDDINPCPPPLAGEPDKGKKAKAKAKAKPQPVEKRPVEYLGFEG